ncbi:GYD domain-containing protein [Candidatus Pelagibacter bacterium]|nr:GYD domain-containing protein [Candidatus Pelagibacter bacterium]
MVKLYVMGKYTEKAFQGFLKDPTTDRKVAVEKLTTAAGGKLHSMDIVRGQYDFIAVVDAPNFDTFAAIKLAVESSGSVKDLIVLEAMDLTNAAKKAGELTGNYKAPGQ